MNVPIDYHILFLVINFFLLILVVLLLFIDASFNKAIASMIFIMFNMVLTIMVGLLFSGIDIYGYDSSGNIVHNLVSDMHPFTYLYLAIFYINIMLLVYCVYLFIKKPWEEYEETLHNNQGY